MSELTPYICVSDSRAAIAWYRDVLGAEVTVEPIVMDDGAVGHCELSVGGARWMMSVRNITMFPNAQFAENASLQLRIWRPLAADRTEMRTFCLAPVGEPAEARALRIRQYEEFFNPSGLATPDDIANYEDCQRGFAAATVQWQQGQARGTAMLGQKQCPAADELGIRPESAVVGSFTLGDETVMHSTYRYWKALIARGLARDGGGKGREQ